ncbi:MAG TPA: RecX family transcriptional regulator [Candidatus Saccharimonadia bacterium]|jgi:regulatory protein
MITDIKQQKRSKGRFSVYVDGKYAFAVSDLDLGLSGLWVGQDISDEQIAELKDSGEESKAYNQVIRYLSYRPRSEREVRDYLVKKGIGEEMADQITGRLRRAGLINDQEFAAGWVANRQLLRPRSRRRLEQELMSKGVSGEQIGAALAEMNPEDELSVLMGVIEKKRRLSQYREPEKLVGYLARQGYGYDLIKKALERLDSAPDF